MGANRTTRTQTRVVVAALSVLLLAGLLGLPAAGGQAAWAQQQSGFGFLTPGPGEQVTDGTLLAVAWQPPDLPPGATAHVEFWGVFNPGTPEEDWQLIGADHDGVMPTRGPLCDIATCEREGIWSSFWVPEPSLPTGHIQLQADAVLCEDPSVPQSCEQFPLDWIDVHRPFVHLEQWETEGLLPAFPPGPVDLGFAVGVGGDDEVDVEDLDVSLHVLPWAFSLEDGKGLPLKDQHIDGADLSSDLDGDGESGDMSCAPTAAASSLAWFAYNDEDYEAILPEGWTNKDLTDRIGEYAGTNDNGTEDPALARAIRRHLDDVDLADDFEVVVTGDMNTAAERGADTDDSPSLEEIFTEHARGQDVLVAFVSDDETTNHMMAVERIATSNLDGTTNVDVMDPWTGQYTTVTVSENGDATHDGEAGWIDAMIHVSPTEEEEGEEVEAEASVEESAEAASEDVAAFQETTTTGTVTVSGTWDATDAEPGRYLVRGRVGAPDTETFTTYQVIEIVPPEEPPVETIRLSGDDRIATAIAGSQDAFEDGTADAVVLARHDTFPDALAGTPLAIARNAPLLLTPPTTLDERVEAEIDRVLPAAGTVVLLGGEAALDPAVETRLAGLGYTTERLGGDNRFETAVVIADEGMENPDTLLLATGLAFPDALAGGAASGTSEAAILLTAGEVMAPATQAYVDMHPGTTRYALGGPAAEAAPDATPLVGATRYETAVEVAGEFFTDPTVVGVATGLDFPDALSGGAHVGRLSGPLLLTTPDALHSAVDAYLRANAASIFTGYLYGGEAALAAAVETAVQDAID